MADGHTTLLPSTPVATFTWAGVAAIALWALLMTASKSMSPVMDELVCPAVGVDILSGGPGFRDVHPAFARVLLALPIATSAGPTPPGSEAGDSVQSLYRFAHDLFCRGSRGRLETLIRRARVVSHVCAIAGMLAGCLLANRLGGPWAGILCALLFCTTPEWVAHGSLATLDMPSTGFVFVAVVMLVMARNHRHMGWMVGSGLAAGMGVASKFSALVVVIAMVAVLLIDFFFACRTTIRNGRRCGLRMLTPPLTFITVMATALLLLAHGGDPARLWATVVAAFGRSEAGHPAYFCSMVSDHGWFAYYPTALLLKTPLGTLALAAAAATVFFRRRSTGSAGSLWNHWSTPLFVCTLAECGWALTTRIDIGLRLILPVYPLVIVPLAVAIAAIQPRAAALALATVCLGLNGIETALVHPHALSFFNVAAGGPASGAEYLSDSNLDWGQDLGNLADLLEKRGRPDVALAYFGPVPPGLYGIAHEPLVAMFGHHTFKSPPTSGTPGLLAVSRTIQTGQYVSGFEWLLSRVPIATAGYSIPLYDITQDADAHRRLADMLDARGEREAAAAHRAAAGLISVREKSSDADPPRPVSGSPPRE